ncbi:CBS domain-containing protein [Streptomyces sp. NPDC057363]|uniref:CBS domain-containing protein n=1 Tax=Streptomyces sp. NPDC057363 TaxID=3346107 RepID=UPI003640B0E8
MAQRVREVMTTAPVMVSMGTPVSQVAVLMRDEGIDAVLVTEGGRLRGLVTDRDLTVRILAEGGNVSDRNVGEACGSELACVAPDDGIDRAVHLMGARALRRLPVIENGRAVGIVTLGNLAAVECVADSAPGDLERR